MFNRHAMRNTIVWETGGHFYGEPEFSHGYFPVILYNNVHFKYVVRSAARHPVSLEDAMLDNRPQT